MSGTLQIQHEKLFEQLDYRETAGIEVSLLWDRRNDALSVFVVDTRDHSAAEIPIGARSLREVFEHPYAYLGEPLSRSPLPCNESPMTVKSSAVWPSA